MSARGRVVVVAGASSESGRAVAAALTQAGAVVVAVGSSLERLADVTASFRLECDLADPVAVDGLAARIREETGKVDGLIHLVGGWRSGQSDEDFDWLERKILTTLRNTTRVLRDDLAASDAGRLAIVSSTSVDRPTWSNANYATIKAASETWVAAVARGWAKGGTAAAVTFAVRSLGDGGTPVEVLANRVAALWDAPAGELNGSRAVL
jgi:NAD(P)-dependent dehydrogenase (short-subunit alcohol dehydrogenase family)